MSYHLILAVLWRLTHLMYQYVVHSSVLVLPLAVVAIEDQAQYLQHQAQAQATSSSVSATSNTAQSLSIVAPVSAVVGVLLIAGLILAIIITIFITFICRSHIVLQVERGKLHGNKFLVNLCIANTYSC